jgi:hypothetical protein
MPHFNNNESDFNEINQSDFNDEGITPVPSKVKFNSDGLPSEISSSGDSPQVSLAKNPYSKWIYLARAIDAWRPFPRAFIILYMYMVYRVVEWYITLDAPSMEQSALISVVVGAGAAWFGLYVGSGRGPNE